MRPHCCETMTAQLTHTCETHADPADCPDALVCYVPKFDEYGLWIHDGGRAFSTIKYCPWCGARLPQSRRDEWFEKLESMGIDDPSEQDVPQQFQSDAWYRDT